MKKLIIVLMLSLATVGFVFAAHNAPVNVFGKITERFTVTSTDSYTSGAGALVLSETGVLKASAVKVGELTVDTNSKYWKLAVSSANSGKLKATDTTTYEIPYALLLTGNGTAEENWTAAQELLDTTEAWNTLATAPFTKRTTPASTDALDVKIYYGAATAATQLNWVASKADGSLLVYTDTVTITASHN